MKYTEIIGIDPDLHRSGIAAIRGCRTKDKYDFIGDMSLWEIFKYLTFAWNTTDTIVLIEDSRLINCSSWHGGGKGASLNVGKNQAISIILEEYMIEHRINYKMIKPSGYSKMFDNIKIFKANTKWEGRTNKDARSAAAIVFSYLSNNSQVK